mmetsp:Transcript_20072/g.55809  ORF Transcript_20072/g.55809 Transcript_20072/m.55809 type:complete len:168 (+) Transcript_20072:375-878(+)
MHLSTSNVFHFQRLRAGYSFDITMAIFEKSFTLESALSSSSQKLLSVEDKIEMRVCVCVRTTTQYSSCALGMRDAATTSSQVQQLHIDRYLTSRSSHGIQKQTVFGYAVAPCQLDPIPAVQPKQWLSVRTRTSLKSSRDSMSKTVFPPRCMLSTPMAYPSCWLKSQS